MKNGNVQRERESQVLSFELINNLFNTILLVKLDVLFVEGFVFGVLIEHPSSMSNQHSKLIREKSNKFFF